MSTETDNPSSRKATKDQIAVEAANELSKLNTQFPVSFKIEARAIIKSAIEKGRSLGIDEMTAAGVEAVSATRATSEDAEPIRVGPSWIQCDKCGVEYNTSDIHECKPDATAADAEQSKQHCMASHACNWPHGCHCECPECENLLHDADGAATVACANCDEVGLNEHENYCHVCGKENKERKQTK